MSTPAIVVNDLGKKYKIGLRQESYHTFRDLMVSMAKAPFRRLRTLGETTTAAEEFWALRDVSFEVQPGEVVGIIGRNGAGKSTLLKILSRITEPTEGMARIHGRVGSLLEVGTGFHPELTGRENIFLNGAILGMRKAEISEKFDEIVAFAEVEQFLDTPVKRYSSGMRVRLAFAVAAHLEPEILIIDEVLAVGDAAFQKKCLGKMGSVARQGRTVLFVSHNMSAVQRLCDRTILLEDGRVCQIGRTSDVVDAYYRFAMEDRRNDEVSTPEVRPGTVRFQSWQLANHASSDSHASYSGDVCVLSFRLHVGRRLRDAHFGLAIWSREGVLIWAGKNTDFDRPTCSLDEGEYDVRVSLPRLPLKADMYQLQISVSASGAGQLDHWYAKPMLALLPRQQSGLPPRWEGLLQLESKFVIEPASQEARSKDH